MHSRALERELVRNERAQERLRVQEGRTAERQRIAKERELALERKQEVKEAQLAEWRMEYEEHLEHESDIDQIANEAPEVEDRDRLYGELAEPRVFEADPFVEPTAPSIDTKIGQLRESAALELASVSATFQPRVVPLRLIQASAAGVTLVGAGLWLSASGDVTPLPLGLFGGGAGAVILLQFLAARAAEQQRLEFVKKAEKDIDTQLQLDMARVRGEMEAAASAALGESRERHDAEVNAARTQHEEEEAARLRELQALVAGDISEMREHLDSVLPLKLPVPSTARATVSTAALVTLELDMPEISALPATEAKLLASGKVSYKEKSPKKLNEQFLRLGVGLAFRYACEVMLNLPTCQSVVVDVFRTTVDPSLGQTVRRSVLHVAFDFPTLAPMTMDGLDPVAALKHFDHKINLSRTLEFLEE